MKYLAFVLVVIFLMISVQDEAAGARRVEVQDGRVTMTLQDAPANEVLDKLFEAAGKEYVLAHGVAMQAQMMKVTLRIENSQFDQALTAVTTAAGLDYKVENGVYTVTPRALGYQRLPQPVSPPPPGSFPLTLRLSAMPVEEAYQAAMEAPYGGLDPSLFPDSYDPDFLGWTFEGDLGKTIMPGATFHSVPVEMAARIVVAAAGLVPPTVDEPSVIRRGPVDFNEIPTPDWRHVGYTSIASYRAPDDEWRYFIRTSRVGVSHLAVQLLSDNTNYVVKYPDDTKAGVSVRLVNVTLDEALTAILAGSGYSYTVENGVYIVRHTSATATAESASMPEQESE